MRGVAYALMASVALMFGALTSASAGCYGDCNGYQDNRGADYGYRNGYDRPVYREPAYSEPRLRRRPARPHGLLRARAGNSGGYYERPAYRTSYYDDGYGYRGGYGYGGGYRYGGYGGGVVAGCGAYGCGVAGCGEYGCGAAYRGYGGGYGYGYRGYGYGYGYGHHHTGTAMATVVRATAAAAPRPWRVMVWPAMAATVTAATAMATVAGRPTFRTAGPGPAARPADESKTRRRGPGAFWISNSWETRGSTAARFLYASTLAASALSWMKMPRGSTSSPISLAMRRG